jgi:transposase
VHPKRIHGYDNDSIRKVKTDKADSVKIANFGLDKWNKLQPYMPEDEKRQTLKALNRQYHHYTRLKVNLKNNLISLLDQSFPGINTLFSSAPRDSDGHEKWVDFAEKYWHSDCVATLTLKRFCDSYQRWCKKARYKYSETKAKELHAYSLTCFSVFPKTNAIKFLISQAVLQLNSLAETQAAVANEMIKIASELPEWEPVIEMFGAGKILASKLIAEIGEVTKFESKRALVCFAGLEPPPHQSGQFESKSRRISKKGSPHLRKTLFQVIRTIIQHHPEDNDVYRFLDRKRSEGKHYYVYMTAASAKFLRVYYGKVKEYLLSDTKPLSIEPDHSSSA